MDKLMNTGQQESIGEEEDILVADIKQLSSDKLFGDAKEIVILHLGESYMLTITKQRKLLLTKIKQAYSL